MRARLRILRALPVGAAAAASLLAAAPARASSAALASASASVPVSPARPALRAAASLPSFARTRMTAECIARVRVPERSSIWAAPLDRIVTVRVGDASVRDALERVASLAELELAYSGELLPQGKRVCLALERVPVGAVLETLLEGTTLRSVVTGASQVVLAPTRAVPVAASTTIRRASVLDRVVVTGTPDGASQRGSPFALDVIDGSMLSRAGASSLGDALELAVPGIWTWSNPAGTLSARFGSIRGASSFGVTTPKIYLDGIEVANPLLVTQLDASRVERVEVIRGPQGAALYGADAISGVVNILTRHDGAPSGGLAVTLSTSAGVAATDYVSRDVMVQAHGASLRAGTGPRTFGMGLSVNTIGEYVPGASEQHILADGDARFVLARSVITTTARLSLQQANASTSLLLGGASPSFLVSSQTAPSTSRQQRRDLVAASQRAGTGTSLDDSARTTDGARAALDSAAGQDVSQYTIGATVTTMPSLRWTNTFIGGIDGYRLRGLSTAGVPLPLSYAADASSGQGAADRGSFRARSVGRFDVGSDATLSLTFGAEHALTRDLQEQPHEIKEQRPPRNGNGNAITGTPLTGTPRPPALQPVDDAGTAGFLTTWTNNTGVLAQANFGWRDRLFVVAGGRAERTTGATPAPQIAYLPLFGMSYVSDVRGMELKVRGAYGTGIRPAHSLARAATWMGRVGNLPSLALEPESQSGVEGGFDLLAGATALHVTRFDQRASGLIQPVTVSNSAVVNGHVVRVVSYLLQNVGAIDNSGWELQASTMLRTLRLSGSYTVTDSRVARVAWGYVGDLRAGDRVLDVPARVGSLTASWMSSRWSASATINRADDWTSYDRVAIGNALLNDDDGVDPREFSERLRDFWVRYDHVTRFRASVGYRVGRQLSMELVGDNLFDVQRGAPDNTTLTAGRTIMLGLRTQF